MGCGPSKSGDAVADARNRIIEQENLADAKVDKQRIKLLLLGAGESGKSTFFKQMRILNKNGFSIDEKKAILPNIHSSIIDAFQIVLKHSKKFGPVKNDDQAKAILAHSKDSLITPSIARAMQELWSEEGMQTTWKRRSEYQVTDSLAWFLLHLERISARDYVPDEQDMLHVRVRTSGIIEEKFMLKGVEFCVFDVGGQRNERKKWIHCFENVTAVMFFVAISEFDQMLYEDSQTKRMDEALTLFDEICNSKFFMKTSMMLFLNKNDMFMEKLADVPFRVDGTGANARFQDYNGPLLRPGTPMSSPEFSVAYKASLKYLTNKFERVNRNPGKQIYIHVTCATDTKNINKVFETCKDIILNKTLADHGFN